MAGLIGASSHQPAPAPRWPGLQPQQLPQASVPSPVHTVAHLDQVQAQAQQQPQTDAAQLLAAGGQSREHVIARLLQVQAQQARRVQEAALLQYQQYSGQHAQFTREHVQLQNELMAPMQPQPPNQPYSANSAMQLLQAQLERAQIQAQQQVQAWLQHQNEHANSTAGHMPNPVPPSAPPPEAGILPPQPAPTGTNMLHVLLPNLRAQQQAQQRTAAPANAVSMDEDVAATPLIALLRQARRAFQDQQMQPTFTPPAARVCSDRRSAELAEMDAELAAMLCQPVQLPAHVRVRPMFTSDAIARAILIQAAELPLSRRHELVSAAAADPDLALAFADPAADSTAELQETEQEQEACDTEPLALALVPEYEQYGLGEEAVRFVVSVKAAAEVKQRAHVALTCVLDRSGSMGGERIKLVCKTCHFLIDQLTDDDYLGIVTYSVEAREELPLLRMTAQARSLARTIINAMRVEGGTALYAGLAAGVTQQMAAMSELKAGAAASRGAVSSRIVHSCFLFTDGEATTGPRTPHAIMRGLASLQSSADQPAKVHTFGFGADHSVELLQGVAEAQAGVYYYISCEADIPSGFGDALGGLLAVVAKDVRLPAVPSASPATAASVFNDMFAEESHECLLVLGLSPVTSAFAAGTAVASPSAQPAKAAGDCVLCHVDLEYTDVATGRRRHSTAALALPRTAAPRAADAQPAELVFITTARYDTLDAIEAAEAAAAAAARPGGGAELGAAHGLLDAHMARLQSTLRWPGGPVTPLDQALDALAAQTQSARASIAPRFEFNAEGVAAAASVAQAKSQYRNMSSAKVAAYCPSVFPPPPPPPM
ncbi:hypothetical protein HXX76_013270 [Chlamydomonas incerta]|uniref:VWFA domain-containing protein n=1 Tax=Chlamydomonas incerta TaxID=51695 RepID=A0A835SF52_CHLIN|nr:hypothetical protein HXX76_013270 [Chlamydomonas incerta]|eukprot:KAG2426082.1 hypothetical protein HXX76_013270 [Chlamydomonas incerta]